MLNIKYKPKGVSLPLITGLVALLMVSSAAVNELIVRSLQSVQRIEASNMAYLAAEGGVEDALYELSPHYAGYQTNATREAKFYDDNNNLRNEWNIVSRSGTTEWSDSINKNQKVLVYLYDDNQIQGSPAINEINENPVADTDIDTLNVNGNLSITFTLPESITTIIGATAPQTLVIDNDNDLWIHGDNEDGVDDSDASCVNPEDADCDGLVDEDSDEDPVIMWKLTDGAEKNLIPIKGCLEEPLPIDRGSEICEKDFKLAEFSGEGAYSVRINQLTEGRNELGVPETIQAFINRAYTDPHSKLHFEFLIVAPMEHVDNGNKKYEIPYIDFKVISDSTEIPSPYFTITSDGYYRDFKQSITATISPKTTVPLFDFTIIQQE